MISRVVLADEITSSSSFGEAFLRFDVWPTKTQLWPISLSIVCDWQEGLSTSGADEGH